MTPVEMFEQDFPFELAKGFTAGTRDCYFATHEIIKERLRNKNPRSNTYPWMRRGLVEDMMLDAAARYNNSVTAEDKRVVISEERTSFWYHTEIRVGRILLTQQASDEEMTVRFARYKLLLAQQSQKLLFPDSHEIETKQVDNVLFATLIHSKNPKDGSKPGFIQIRFPRSDQNGNLDGFHPGHIDLMTKFEELFTEAAYEESVAEPDPQPIDVRKAR